MANRTNQTTVLPSSIDTTPSNESPTTIFWTTTLHLLTSSAPNVTNSSASNVIPNITVLKRQFCTEPGKLWVCVSLYRTIVKLVKSYILLLKKTNSYKNTAKFTSGHCKWAVEMWLMKSLGNKISTY